MRGIAKRPVDLVLGSRSECNTVGSFQDSYVRSSQRTSSWPEGRSSNWAVKYAVELVAYEEGSAG